MNGIKREYEEWNRFVDDIKKRRIEEVFYTVKVVQSRKATTPEEKDMLAFYAIFSALKEFKNQDGTAVTHFYTHTAYIGEFPNDMPSNDVWNQINPVVDKTFIQPLQLISVPIIIKGQISEV